jgi:CDP-diacylglycerol---glycerol-3-phosphate 3-phosphatidyltransferase
MNLDKAIEEMARENILNWPNALTFFRLLILTPVAVYLYLGGQDYKYWAALVFASAALTDGLDGWLARRYRQRTKIGAFLDPIADKFLVVSLLLLFWINFGSWPWLIYFLAIAMREIWIIVSRVMALGSEQPNRFRVRGFGRKKSLVQYLGVIYVILNWPYAGLALLPAAVLTVWSGYHYWQRARTEPAA